MEWTELKLFQGIDLNDSFVLGWRHEGWNVIFDIEASIWPSSEHYMTPKANEYTCYRRATLAFENISECVGLLPMASAPKSTDEVGEIDFGNIDSLFLLEDGFEVSGDFGNLSIKGGELLFEIHT
ncbi:hypothetical protein [Alcanivorax sp.]|jgi:hypothetical protein|uniref:hypothetical protein n=1 Tax=Alcanivorax sp. TaxID=1872427 RepID=UPI0032D8B511